MYAWCYVVVFPDASIVSTEGYGFWHLMFTLWVSVAYWLAGSSDV